MIIRAAPIALTMFMGHAAHAFDAELATGLDVVLERVPEDVTVDGVKFTIQRAAGTDVPKLANRIESRWRSAGSEVRPLHLGEWTVLTRMQGLHSEVLQWRMNGGKQELLWSMLHTAAALERTPETGLVLPAQCSWVRSVHGTSAGRPYLQRSAHCAMSAESLKAGLTASMPSQGWRIVSAEGSGLTLDRSDADGLLALTPVPGSDRAWVIWLRVERQGDAP